MPTKSLLTVYNEELEKNIFLRNIVADKQCYEDVFEKRYHVPPLDVIPQTVLDLGSNIGLTVTHYAHMWPTAIIVGYEMDKDNCEIAQTNTYRPIINCAVAPHRRVYSYDTSVSEQAYSISTKIEGEPYIIPAVTLDDAINQVSDELGMVDFVKMDIEGAERDILSTDGAWSHRIRNLLVECHGKDEDDTEYNTKYVEFMLTIRGFNVKKHLPHWSALFAWK